MVIRTYLETEAITKSTYLAKEYIEKQNLCTTKEKENLLSEYKKINKMGNLFMIDNLLTSRVDMDFIV